MKKKISFLLLIFILCSSFAYSDELLENDKISNVAVVNGEEISKDEFEKMLSLRKYAYVEKYGNEIWEKVTEGKKMKDMVGKQLLNSMIIEKLKINYVKKYSDFYVSREKQDQLLLNYKNSIKDDKKKIKYHEDNGITDEFIRNQLIENQYSIKYYNMIKNSILSNKALLEKKYKNEVVEVNASHILLDELTQAEKIYNKVLDGNDFANLAKEYSLCPSKEKGGNLGSFPRGKMVKAFEEAAFNLEAGAISKPIKTQFGYHIIKMNSNKTINELMENENLDEFKINRYKNLLISDLTDKKMKSLNKELLKKSNIEKKIYVEKDLEKNN